MDKCEDFKSEVMFVSKVTRLPVKGSKLEASFILLSKQRL